MSIVWAKDHEIKEEKGALLLLYVQPGASRTEVKGLHGERLKISVKAPPVDGAANQAIIEFLAKAFKTPKSRVHIVSGETSRQKNIFISGHTAFEAMAVFKD